MLSKNEINMRNNPGLKNLVARYKMHKEMLEKHPEQKELLERKIEQAKQDIVDYVTNKRFEAALNAFNL